MNILGFNPSHHGSVCLLQDGELTYFIQEERIGNREKYSSLPFIGFIDILRNYKIDWISWGSPTISYKSSSIQNFPYWQKLAFKYNPGVKYFDYSSYDHHRVHIAHSFYNSNFKKAIGIVIDGVGSVVSNKKNKKPLQETESVYICEYPNLFTEIFKNTYTRKNINTKKEIRSVNLSQVYEAITMYLGWDMNSAGKTMGLAPYGKYNSNLPNFFTKSKSGKIEGNPQIFYELPSKEKHKIFYGEDFPELKLSIDPKEWHYNKSKITNLEKDLAWKIQNDTQQIVGNYIENAIQETGLKQVCCAGGYFLNCVTNYYLAKRFPDIEFYFEPVANDAGTAIGAAKLLWHSLKSDTTIRPFKSLYLGKEYSKNELLKGINKYVDN